MPLSSIPHWTDEGFDEELRSVPEPVLVEFWADWCGPCRTLDPVIEEVAAELAGRVRFARVNVDASGDLVNRFGIRSVPTLMVFKGGKVVDQVVGTVTKPEIVAILERHLREGV